MENTIKNRVAELRRNGTYSYHADIWLTFFLIRRGFQLL